VTYGVGLVFHGERSRPYGFITLADMFAARASSTAVKPQRPAASTWLPCSGLAWPNHESVHILDRVQSCGYSYASMV
jgi:hypothetical protein